MIQIECRCGRKVELLHAPQSGVVRCMGCFAEISVLKSGASQPSSSSGNSFAPRELWITCPYCLCVYTRPADLSGQKIDCRTCGKSIRITSSPAGLRKGRPRDRRQERLFLNKMNVGIFVFSLLVILTIVGRKILS